jgi:uncharacterized protein (TIGR04255 family)
MPPGGYARPPITEAVIEVRFGSGAEPRMLTRFLRSVARQYPTAEQTYEISAQIRIAGAGTDPEVRPEQKFTGYKLTGEDAADLILLGFDKISAIRMAPYYGWENFAEKFKKNYEILRKICGHRSIVRVATRYVNRLDIPADSGVRIRTEDYLLLEPRVPNIIPQVNHFFSSFTGIVSEIEGQVNINSGTVISPLIDHVSLLLDIDLFKEQNLPQRDGDMWGLLTSLRERKNILFEAFVTDRARELFDRA